MKFEINPFHKNTSEDELLEDLKKIHEILDKKGISLTYRYYNEYGKFSSGTFQARFGSWNLALKKANIEVTEEKNATDLDLFSNLEHVWTSLGRQPVTRDLVKPLSKYRYGVYADRFGSWSKSLEAFVTFINEEESESLTKEVQEELELKVVKKRRTSRNISDRMRFHILSRDGFTCQSCGASPIKERDVKLHVDHKIPWSKGGETLEENLEAKCEKCNLGKGNAFYQ